MREHYDLCRDITIFLVIAFVAYPFAYMGVSGPAEMIGKIISITALVFAVICFAVKRPPPV